MTSVKFLITGIVVAGMVCGLVYMQGGFSFKTQPGVTPLPAEKAGPVKTVKAEVTKTVGEVTVSGTVVARETAKVAARVLGHVVELKVAAGDRVEKGQVLLRLDVKELEEKEAQAAAALESAKVDFAKTAQDFERFKALYEKESVAKKDFDDVKAKYEMAQAAQQRAQAALEEARTQLSYTIVTAPFDSVVSSKDVNVGDLASPGQTLLSLYMPGTLELIAAVGEQYGPFLKPGTPVFVAVESAGAKQASTIREVVPQRDEKTRTITVKAPLASAAGLDPGQYGTLTFHTRSSEAITIPASALLIVGQLESVKVKEDGIVRIRYVKTGRTSNDGNVEIISGLKADEEVVVP